MQASVNTIKHSTWLSLSLCLLASPSILANTEWQTCEVTQEKPRKFSAPNDLQIGDVYIEANKALIKDEGASVLTGDALVVKDGQQYTADSITYDRESEVTVAKGNVKATTETLHLNSKEAEFNLKTDNNTVKDASYSILEQNGTFNGRGTSKTINQFGNELTYLNNATYTTCPPAEKPSWHLDSTKIKLNHEKEYGTAKNVVLKVGKKNVPIFYFPYFSFPLTDKRKSGFLLPSYANNSKSGLSLSLPYYFNLAPNYDFTFTPQYLTKRGLKLNNEFRYLTNNNNGILRYDALFNDNSRNGDNRYYYDVNHFTKFGQRSSIKLQAEGVSDSNYFDDFSTNLESSSRTLLERELEIETSGKGWSLEGRIQEFQLLDGGSNPYRRFPQIVLDYDPEGGLTKSDIDFSVTSELVHFNKQISDSAPTATRLDVSANLSKNFSSLAYFFKPSLDLRFTQYDLTINDGSTVNEKPSRLLPTATIDSGLFFERSFDNGKKLQTLEPRLYYTHTPFEDQSDIPIFDTSEYTLQNDSIFSKNRFSGKDRIEDTNRLSASLTSRVLDQDTGEELFTASIGQLFHFADRNVTLPGRSAKTDSRSELALEFSGNLNKNTKISSTSLWESDANNILSGQLGVSYNNDKNRSAYGTYRYREDSLEQLDAGFSTPINSNWSMVGSWNHDLQNERLLENKVGVSYKNCCIKSNIVARKYLTSDNDTYDNAIFMEIGFKGLGEFSYGE